MESIPLLAEMIINSLDYEKMLKHELQERNLEYILNILSERCGFATNELFTLDKKEKIEKVIQTEIDDNHGINIKIKSKDKNRFANIVMDIKTITDHNHQNNNLDHPSSLSLNKMAAHTQTYQTAPDQFGYIPSHSHAHSHAQYQPQPPMQHQAPSNNTMIPNYHPHAEYENFSTPPPIDTLNFDLDAFPDDISELRSVGLPSVGLMPISQPQAHSEFSSIPNNIHPPSIPSHANNHHQHHQHQHPTKDEQQPLSSPNLANAFEKKMKEAIQKNEASTNPVPTKSIRAQKAIPASTNIHPQQQTNVKPPTQTQQTWTNTHTPQHQPIEAPYDFSDEDEAPIGGMAPPVLNITDNQEPEQFYTQNGQHSAAHTPASAYHHHQSPPQVAPPSTTQYTSHPHQTNGNFNNDFSAPTPRGWNFQPVNYPQSTRPSTSNKPRISDPMLIQNALQRVAYYADKLDSLHSEYRRCYSEQQQLSQRMQALESQQMDPTEYQRNVHHLQSQHYSFSEALRRLLIDIYDNFNKMQEAIGTRYELALDPTSKSEFDKFHRYYQQFKTTQWGILQCGQQQHAEMQQKAQPQPNQQQQPHQQQAQANGYYPNHNANGNNNQSQKPYTVPPTPSYHQNHVQTVFANGPRTLQQPQHLGAINAMTPRQNNKSYQFGGQQPQHRNYAKTTTSTERKFVWGQQQQQQMANQPIRSSITPRVTRTVGNGLGHSQNHRMIPSFQPQMKPNNGSNNSNGGNNGNVNNNKKNGNLEANAYVYIGSRMSQLISQIGLSDVEVEANQKRIKSSINDILKSEQYFTGFDIVSYGSSAHKLFIKDYSDFDFVIRCKKLSISHDEAIQYIATALSETKKNEFDNVKIIESVEQSVHGHYLKDIHHISFLDKKSGRKVDLVLNNFPEIGSSRFIAAYESIDTRFHLLCRVIKYWAQQRKINNSLNGTLSTYALVLMVINFLQTRRVLPTLSLMITDREKLLSPWSMQDDYQINVQKYRDFASKNEESGAKLLVNFFNFYAHKFNFEKDVVSVRTGTQLLKSEKKWKSDNAHYLCVENPFNSKTNLTANVDPENLKRIHAEFKRAHSILCDSYRVYDVCKLAEN